MKKKVSFCLFSYNQENYIEAALKGALSQEYPFMEIIVSDDHSSDNTYEIIEEILKNYNGPHEIKVNRNDFNMGLVAHLNKLLMNYVCGDLILLAAGDDISLPHRTTVTLEYFEKYQEALAVCFPLRIIDKNNKFLGENVYDRDILYELDKSYLSSSSFMVDGGSLAIKRDVIDFFGPLQENCPTEDSTFRLRALLLGSVVRGTVVCMEYRRHESSISAPDNIHNLKTELIANQYCKDILTAYEKGKISLFKKKVLFLKVNYYAELRELSFIKRKSTNPIVNLFLRLKMMTITAVYRIKLWGRV